jgi:hypothetical protein
MKFEAPQLENIEQKQSEKKEKFSANEITGARNGAQFKLASRYYGFEVDDNKFFEWEEKNSKKFGDIVDAEPSLLVRYLSGEESEVLDEISGLLYDKHEVHA